MVGFFAKSCFSEKIGFLELAEEGFAFISYIYFAILFFSNCYFNNYTQKFIIFETFLQIFQTMLKRNSVSKINGKIIMMQNDLMSKLATIDYLPKTSTDELGFPTLDSQFDSLTNLLSKAKSVTNNNKDKILVARKSSNAVKLTLQEKKPKKAKNKAQTGTFLTGVGLSTELEPKKRYSEQEDQQTKLIHRDYYSNPSTFEQQDPDEMIKQMIKKSQQDDLAELRRMIKETDSSLQDYGRQLQRTRKEVMIMADKFNDIDYDLIDKIARYDTKNY